MDVRYVTIAYGPGSEVYGQASLLLVSLLAYAPAPRELLVVTDHPGQFDWLRDEVRVHSVTSERLRSWQGPEPFSMRMKLEVARLLAPASGALVLMDADTVAVDDLSPLLRALEAGT